MKALLLAPLLLLASCATQIGSPDREADARLTAGDKEFLIWLDPDQNAGEIEGGFVTNAAARTVKAVSLDAIVFEPDYDVWLSGARALVEPIGCQVISLYPVHPDTQWAFTYACPADVNLYALAVAQREQLRAGAPLHR